MENYHPVIHLPVGYELYDFSQSYDPSRPRTSAFGIGRYDEKRPGMYTTDLFTAPVRDIHVGVDIGAPVGTPIHSFDEGEVFLFGYNPADGDYGYTLITRHQFQGKVIYALFGHLAKASVDKKVGQKIERGEVIAWVGDRHENGNWNPHLHFQLSWVEPKICDMPGVVSEDQRAEALKIYPDPRLVLGPIY